jgi:hypothetical protein
MVKVDIEGKPGPTDAGTSVSCCGENVSAVKWASKPVIKKLGQEREESYLELFYDLIIVVVFMRLVRVLIIALNPTCLERGPSH